MATPHHSIVYRPDALLTPNQQCQNTEGKQKTNLNQQSTLRIVHTCTYDHCVQLTVVHNTAHNRSDNLPSYPLDNHHSSDVLYWRGRGTNSWKCMSSNHTADQRLLHIKTKLTNLSYYEIFTHTLLVLYLSAYCGNLKWVARNFTSLLKCLWYASCPRWSVAHNTLQQWHVLFPAINKQICDIRHGFFTRTVCNIKALKGKSKVCHAS